MNTQQIVAQQVGLSQEWTSKITQFTEAEQQIDLEKQKFYMRLLAATSGEQRINTSEKNAGINIVKRHKHNQDLCLSKNLSDAQTLTPINIGSVFSDKKYPLTKKVFGITLIPCRSLPNDDTENSNLNKEIEIKSDCDYKLAQDSNLSNQELVISIPKTMPIYQVQTKTRHQRAVKYLPQNEAFSRVIIREKEIYLTIGSGHSQSSYSSYNKNSK